MKWSEIKRDIEQIYQSLAKAIDDFPFKENKKSAYFFEKFL